MSIDAARREASQLLAFTSLWRPKWAIFRSAQLNLRFSMKLCGRLSMGLPKGLSIVIAITLGFTPQSSLATTRTTDPNLRQTYRPCRQQGKKHFQVIVYGDEPAGLMTALELNRQLSHGAKSKKPALQLLSTLTFAKGLEVLFPGLD